VVRFFISKGIDPGLLSAVGNGAGIHSAQVPAPQRFGTERKVTFQTFINGKEAGP
jgi:hypothetical protein